MNLLAGQIRTDVLLLFIMPVCVICEYPFVAG